MTDDQLARFLEDVEVIATEDGLSDEQRGRLLREAWPTDDGLERAPDGSIIRHGVSGWTR